MFGKIITQQTFFWSDDSVGMNLGLVKIQPFVPQSDTYFRIENRSHFWVKVPLGPSKVTTQLKISSAILDSVVMFEPYLSYQGDMVLTENGSAPIVPVFNIPAHDEDLAVYLRISSPQELVLFAIEHGTIEEIQLELTIRTLIQTVLAMILFVVAVLSVLMYNLSPSKLGFYLIWFSIFSFLFLFTITGVAKVISCELQYFLNYFNVPIQGMMVISGVFLCIRLLRVHYYSRALYFMLLGISALTLVFILLYLLGFLQIASARAVVLMGGLVTPIYIYSSWKTYRDSKPYALYLLIGWVLYFVVMLYVVMVMYGVVKPGKYIDYAIPSISLVYLLFVITSIIGKVSYYRSEREKSEKAHLENVSRLNSILEEKVKDRTHELEQLNSAINKQNVELKAHKEKIILMNESLEKAVEDRTSELSMALLNLEKRTKELEEFSHVVSHNLRGPVASLLGLIQVYDKNDPANPANKELVEYMDVSASGLDKVITDLNQILTIKKMGLEERIPVNLVEVFELTKTLLAGQIKESGAQIVFNYCREEINSIPAFLNNIFYNLIANSIKYARPNILPLITVDMECDHDVMVLRFKDNGIGMSVSDSHKDYIFKMYYRVSKVKEGKGVGLYLVKSQAESLGGTMDYSSTLGKILRLQLRFR